MEDPESSLSLPDDPKQHHFLEARAAKSAVLSTNMHWRSGSAFE